MGTRAERNKEDFVGGGGFGFGFGVVEPSYREVLIPSHHYPSYISPSSYCSTGFSNPVFSASSNHTYNSSLGEMFSLTAGSNSAAVSAADPVFTLSSSGEMGRIMSEKEGSAAFSEAQWQELERQRNIYEYIMASLPVPPELLTPFPKHSSNTYHQDVAKGGGSLKLGIASNASNNAADMEPWRCKRTDGKKWRCSRNVVPDQKYCERHAHKSRPRSRKHVESSQHSDTRTTRNVTSQYTGTYPQFYGQPVNPFSAYSTLPSSNDHHREFRWFMKEDDGNANLNPAVGVSRELKRGFDYDLNFRQNEPLVDQSFGALEGLLSPNRQETRRFFVEGDQDEAMGSSLTLSMPSGGMEELERRNQHQWVSHEGPSWLCSTAPGGPLAEALFLGASNNPSASTTTSSCSRSSS